METAGQLTPKQAQALILAKQWAAAHKREFPPTWYDWQMDGFFNMKPEAMTLAGNQTGKTWSGAYHFSLDVTGRYPDWWEGFRFDHSVDAMAIGVDSDQLLVIQTNLFGKVKDKRFEGGWIHADEIDHNNIEWATGSKGIAKRVAVLGKYGRSTVHLRSYTQTKTGQATLSFAGYIFDVIWADEQPPDALCSQLRVRLTNGNRGAGGRLRYTMTPELGWTQEVTNFLENPNEHQKLIGPVNWRDCSHITPEVRDRLLAGIPEHEHDMRSSGMPYMGTGLIYPVPEDRIMCDQFEIPPWWRCLKGIDLGHTHPTAITWCAWNPENDLIALVRSYSVTGEAAAYHVQALNSMWEHVPTVFPPDIDATEKGSGHTVRHYYRQAGLKRMLDFENPDGSRYVEPGILNLHNRMKEGRFVAFRGMNDPFFKEKRMYHRTTTPTGTVKIVKEHDDVMDSLRYNVQMIPKRGVPLERRTAPTVNTLAKQRQGIQRGMSNGRR